MNGEDLKKQALKFYQLCYPFQTNFNATDGWLYRFKQRFGIRYLTVSGEKLSNKESALNSFREIFIETITEMKLTEDQIYNADESGLYWKQFQMTRTLVHKEEKSAPGIKESNQRITIMPCSNISGENKIQLMVIGTSKNPRPFKNIQLPVSYYNSKKGWMTRDIFTKWFYNEFIPSVRDYSQNKNITPSALLILDNAPSHHTLMTLESDDKLIKTLFIPPNSTAIIQPMDQNVINILKKNYKKMLVEDLLLRDTVGEGLKDLNLKDVVFMIKNSWDSVSKKIIRQSWKHLMPEILADQVNDADIDISIIETARHLKECENFDRHQLEANIASLNEQEDVQYEILSDPDIVTYIKNSYEDVDKKNDNKVHMPEMDTDIETVEIQCEIYPSVALESFKTFMEFVEQSNIYTEGERLLLRRMQEKLINYF